MTWSSVKKKKAMFIYLNLSLVYDRMSFYLSTRTSFSLFNLYFHAEAVTLDNFIAFPRPFLATIFLSEVQIIIAHSITNAFSLTSNVAHKNELSLCSLILSLTHRLFLTVL